MSYILDALRKSEQQRQHGAAPSLLAVQAAYDADTRPPFLIYGLIATFLIVAGVAIGWSRPWQHELSTSAKDSSAARLFEPDQRRSQPAPSVFSDAGKRSGQEQSVRVPVVSAHTAGARKAPSVAEVRVQPRGQGSGTPDAISAERAKARVMAAPVSTNSTLLQQHAADNVPASVPQERKLVAMGELPPAIRQEIPEISIQGHVYSSEPKDRIVGINERLLKEGEYLAPGLRLEQITPEGLVFSYKNYLFRRDL
jgi:general secretion pathway protein B